MVFFCCEGCNETLKKNHVEGHMYKCSSCWGVSCVDCSKIFKGDEYKQHVTCISEAEKYQKSLYRGPKGNKKRNPQEEWMDTIAEAAAEISRGGQGPYSNLVRTSVVKMAEMGNVPRNEKKFKNFLKNSLRIFKEPEAEELWRFLESRRAKAAAKENASNGATGVNEVPERGGDEEQNGHHDHTETSKPKKEKKRKKVETEEAEEVVEEEEEEEELVCPNPKKKRKKAKRVQPDKEGVEDTKSTPTEDQPLGFNWEKQIVKVLKKAENRQMPLAALKKEVVRLALSCQGQGGGLDKKTLKKVFKRKVAGHSQVVVDEANDLALYTKG